jgi:hypothetical protein
MSKSASSKEPYEDSIRVVWHEPTQFDPLRHGPPYLPAYKPVRLSSDERSVVRAFVKTARVPEGPAELWSGSPLTYLLSTLQAASLIHQTHHWSTNGPTFFADHLLFERLYNESQQVIDQLAEMAVGSNSTKAIDAIVQATQMLDVVKYLRGVADAVEGPRELALVRLSLFSEMQVLKLVDQTFVEFEQSQQLSHGLSKLLEDIAYLHETFVYGS